MKHIAIAGLGVVGGGVAEILLKNAALLEKTRARKSSSRQSTPEPPRRTVRLRRTLSPIFLPSSRTPKLISWSKPSAAAPWRSILVSRGAQGGQARRHCQQAAHCRARLELVRAG